MKRRLLFLVGSGLLMFMIGSAEASSKGSMSGAKSMDGMMKENSKYSIPEDVQKKMNEARAMSVAQIFGTTEDSPISGWIKFFELDGGVHVFGQLDNVDPGDHGIHIHENGSCADGGKAAGGHFNPHKTDHGYLPEDGEEKAHVGDMGNISINDNGKGTLNVYLPDVKFDGPHGIQGLAVILHAKSDDFGQPTGNAGGRIGCGLIAPKQVLKDSDHGSPKGSMKGSTTY